MSTRELYIIHDSEANYAGQVMQFRNDKEAMRIFFATLAGAEKNSVMHAHPEHFQLLHIGQLSEDTGEILHTQLTQVTNGSVWRELQQQQREMAVVQ